MAHLPAKEIVNSDDFTVQYVKSKRCVNMLELVQSVGVLRVLQIQRARILVSIFGIS